MHDEVQFWSDDLEHAGEMHDVVVPEADDAIAAARDLQAAGGVVFLLLCVLAAVEFNRELATGAGEIDDMRSDRMLPPSHIAFSASVAARRSRRAVRVRLFSGAL